jgi:medium-chain acyl-[acyl-carrier-protein] hydrolase
LSTVDSRTTGRWTPWHNDESAWQRIRFYCFPHAGGSASAFRPWARLNPYSTYQVVPVELPGRGARRAEVPCVRMSSLVDQFVRYLAGRPARERFALYGHSMGASIAYEVVRRLEAEPGGRPLALVASGAPAPGISAEPDLGRLPDDELIATLAGYGGIPQEVLEIPEAIQAALPVIRADLALLTDWAAHRLPVQPVACRVVALGGSDDTMVPPPLVEAWRSCAGPEFRSRILPGDHFFVHADPRPVLSEMHRAVV